jgi:rod shape determining protein RodA
MGRALRLDWPIVALGLLLSGYGLVMVYSATWRAGETPGFFASEIFIKQCVALVLGVTAFHFIRRIKWGLKPDSWIWFYVPVLLLLVLVLIIGGGPYGVKRWIYIGPMQLQPSEPAKLTWIMLLAWLFSAPDAYLKRNYFIALALMLSMVGLMMAQPDLGTSMVFVFAFFVMAWLAAVPRRLVWGTVLACVIVALPGFFFLRTYQQNRVYELFGRQKWIVVDKVTDKRFQVTMDEARKMVPEERRDRLEVGHAFFTEASAQGTAWQATQGMIALGSGGLTGKGFLRGTQSKGGFVPEVESDFIFTLVGEEFGFIGCAFLLLLFFLLIARVLALSYSTQTTYERYICYGASAVLLFHVFINAGMTMKIVPVTGVPLPFISQGGSSLITFWVLLAVLESIYEKSQGEYLRVRREARRRALA